MSEKKELNNEELEKVSGGQTVNGIVANNPYPTPIDTKAIYGSEKNEAILITTNDDPDKGVK